MRFLFIPFVILPVLEIMLLIRVGGWIGVWPTVFLVLSTAFIGVMLLRRQGLKTLFRINERLAHGEVPAREMLEGLMLAIGGALLLAPGFITDTMALICLLPPTRRMLLRAMARRVRVYPGPGAVPPDMDPHGDPRPPRRPEVIEGDFRRED